MEHTTTKPISSFKHISQLCDVMPNHLKKRFIDFLNNYVKKPLLEDALKISADKNDLRLHRFVENHNKKTTSTLCEYFNKRHVWKNKHLINAKFNWSYPNNYYKQTIITINVIQKATMLYDKVCHLFSDIAFDTHDFYYIYLCMDITNVENSKFILQKYGIKKITGIMTRLMHNTFKIFSERDFQHFSAWAEYFFTNIYKDAPVYSIIHELPEYSWYEMCAYKIVYQNRAPNKKELINEQLLKLFLTARLLVIHEKESSMHDGNWLLADDYIIKTIVNFL